MYAIAWENDECGPIMVYEESIKQKGTPMKTAIALYALMFTLLLPIVYAVWSL